MFTPNASNIAAPPSPMKGGAPFQPQQPGFHPAAPNAQPAQGGQPQQVQHPQGQQPGMAPPGAPGMAPGAEIFQENIDSSIQVPKRISRLTANHVPSSASLGHQCKVPLGAIIRPLAPSEGEGGDVKVVQPGAAGIVRCKR